MISRRALPAVGLAVAFGAAGCVQVPKPISATPPPRPTVDAADVPAILKRYEESYAKAAKSYDVKAIARIEAAPMLQGTVHHLSMNNKFKTAPDEVPTLIDPDVIPVAAGDFPRVFLAVSQMKNGDETRVLTVHQRTSTTDSWQMCTRIWVGKDEVPPFVRKDGFAELIPADTKEFDTAPGEIPGVIAEAMENPKSKAAGRMAPTDAWKKNQESVAEDRKLGDGEGVSMRISVRPAPEVTAVRTTEGVATMIVVEYVTSWDADDGWIVRYNKKNPAAKYYPYEYRSLISGSRDGC
ncbi:MAG: hypothetical protein L0G99_08150 [Propionibacteriales bacterium]|nr:hypothetical protein [Propionibacteriales bacterium]